MTLKFYKFRTKTSKILPKTFFHAWRDAFDSSSKTDGHLSIATLQLKMPCASAITLVTGYQFELDSSLYFKSFVVLSVFRTLTATLYFYKPNRLFESLYYKSFVVLSAFRTTRQWLYCLHTTSSMILTVYANARGCLISNGCLRHSTVSIGLWALGYAG